MAIERRSDWLDRCARQLLLLLVFSLAFMQPVVPALGFEAVATDLLFLLTALALAASLAARQTPLAWDRAYLVLAVYFAALAVSAFASAEPARSAVKLATQVYLLALPVLVVSLVRDSAALRRALLWWLAGSAAVALVAAASLTLFVLDPDNALLDRTLFYFGTLPPGSYPRLRATFLNGNMMCNYLTVSLAILLAAARAGWIGRAASGWLLAGIGIAAFFTLSPGFGGVLLALGLWLWLAMRESRRSAARLALAAGTAAALLFVALMAATPIVHETAPFLMRVPGTELVLAPSGRLMVWIDSARTFLADPLIGRGIGNESAHVLYRDPSGHLQRLTDAHNVFLNIAAQCGIVGVAALLWLIAHAVRRSLPWLLLPGDTNLVRLGLGLGFLNGFVYHGLGGSWEDARHLWVALGLLIAAARIEPRASAAATASEADPARGGGETVDAGHA